MSHRDRQRGSASLAFVAAAAEAAYGQAAGERLTLAKAKAWAYAVLASTLLRLRRGEGALLAINVSIVLLHPSGGLYRYAAGAFISVLAMVSMYALNDAYDAPGDRNNPRKDRALVSIYLADRAQVLVSVLLLKIVTVVLAFTLLGLRAGAATAAVLLLNLVYSTALKGVPVVDVLWCGLWGAAYAAIVSASPSLLIVVGVMTAICHLYQTLNDRESDAVNGVKTTAVRSNELASGVMIALCTLLLLALRAPVGPWSLTALLPLAFHFAVRKPATGWLLTKAYFAFAWLAVLGVVSATG